MCIYVLMMIIIHLIIGRQETQHNYNISLAFFLDSDVVRIESITMFLEYAYIVMLISFVENHEM